MALDEQDILTTRSLTSTIRSASSGSVGRRKLLRIAESQCRLAIATIEPHLGEEGRSEKIKFTLYQALELTQDQVHFELASDGSFIAKNRELADHILDALRRCLDSAASHAKSVQIGDTPHLIRAEKTATRLRRLHRVVAGAPPERAREYGQTIDLALMLYDELGANLQLDRQPLQGFDPAWQHAWLASLATAICLVAADGGGVRGKSRVAEIDQRTINETLNAFESPLRGVVNSCQDGLIDPDDEEFVMATLQQLSLERSKDRSNPQIIELLIAGLVTTINGDLEDRPRFELEFIRLGSNPATAAVAADRMCEAIRMMKTLGDDDPQTDAQVLDNISAVADYLDEVSRSFDESQKTQSDEFDSLRKKAGETVATEVTKEVVGGLRTLIKDNWMAIAHGFILAWRAAKGLIT